MDTRARPVWRELGPSKVAVVDYDEEVFMQLTREQARAVQGNYSNERVRVEGPAVSGKTLLALERARKFAEEGKRVLFLCYNRNLADWLQREADTLRGLEVYDFMAKGASASRGVQPRQGAPRSAMSCTCWMKLASSARSPTS